MKTTFKIIVMVLVAAFYGCQKDDVSPGMISSVTSDGVFSGTIVNDSNRIDSIKAYGSSDNIIGGSTIYLGNCAVLANGKFSVALTNPVLRKIVAFPSGVVVSDTTAMIGSMFVFEAFGGTYTGTLYKANYSLDDSTKAGNSESEFIYSDRAFTKKGTGIYAYTIYGVTSNFKLNYNLTFKKGWNEIVRRVDSYSHTSTTSTTEETYSNTITSDLQWRCITFTIAVFTIHAKTRGVHSVVKHGLLF